MKVLILIAFSFCLVSCSMLQKQKPSEKIIEEQEKREKLFNKGVAQLDAENYAASGKIFHSLVKKAPVTRFEVAALYNLGLSYEGLGRCKSAAIAFRRVLKASAANNKKMKAQAIYRLSQAYECLKQDTRVISSLVDLQKHKRYLPDAIAYAEAPARLAGAYARVGNRQKAEEYFKQAERGLNVISNQQKTNKEKQEILARTLYQMGRLKAKDVEVDKTSEYLKGLEQVQKYLLQSVEVSHPKWSQRAANEIINSYDHVWTLLSKMDARVKQEQDPIAKKKLRTETSELTKMALNNLEILRRLQFPSETPLKMTEDLFAKLKINEKQYYSLLADHSLQLEETKDSQRRFGDKRNVKLVSPKKKERK